MYQSDADQDKSIGLNTYVNLTSNSVSSFINSDGMYAVAGPSTTGVTSYGSETVAWYLNDEVDMNVGPCPNGCNTLNSDVTGLPQGTGRPYYANFGKGIMYWEPDDQAKQLINGGYTNFLSDDSYFYSDNDVCSNNQADHLIVGTGPTDPSYGGPSLTSDECHRSSNYGVIIDRLRALVTNGSGLTLGTGAVNQSIWGIVETGHPGGDGTIPAITGPQIQGAVMASLIHEARGIIYFTHSLCTSNCTYPASSCTASYSDSDHGLRDNCFGNTPYVTQINGYITQLAPVLNTQSLGWSFNSGLSTMLKYGPDGSYYIFAEQAYPNDSGSYIFSLPQGMTTATSAQVLYENRTVSITGGTFQDSFAQEYSWHIYKIPPS